MSQSSPSMWKIHFQIRYSIHPFWSSSLSVRIYKFRVHELREKLETCIESSLSILFETRKCLNSLPRFNDVLNLKLRNLRDIEEVMVSDMLKLELGNLGTWKKMAVPSSPLMRVQKMRMLRLVSMRVPSSEFSSGTHVKLELETRTFLLMKMIIKTWSFCEITEPTEQLNVLRTNFRLVFGRQLHRD